MDRLLCCEEGNLNLKRSFRDRVLVEDERVLQNLLSTEDHHAPSPNYFLFQEDLHQYMRQVVTSWMLEVCEEQGREEEVFPTAVNYLDRVLSTVQIKRRQLQLVASVCMFIASKVREADPIDAQKLVIYTDFSITLNDLLEWELLILQLLKWDTSVVLAHDFLDLILTRLPIKNESQKPVIRHAQTFIAMCATEFSFCVHPPSVIASSSLSAALSGLNGQEWCQQIQLHRRLQDITSIDAECIEACQEQIEQVLARNVVKESSLSHNNSVTTPMTSSNQKSSDPTLSSTPTDIREIHLCQ